jgi:hypothetical protein
LVDLKLFDFIYEQKYQEISKWSGLKKIKIQNLR